VNIQIGSDWVSKNGAMSNSGLYVYDSCCHFVSIIRRDVRRNCSVVNSGCTYVVIFNFFRQFICVINVRLSFSDENTGACELYRPSVLQYVPGGRLKLQDYCKITDRSRNDEAGKL